MIQLSTTPQDMFCRIATMTTQAVTAAKEAWTTGTSTTKGALMRNARIR